MDKRRIGPLFLAAAITAAALWTYVFQPRMVPRVPEVVPLQDGKTIDFSGGTAEVRNGPADKAAVDKAVKDMDAASGTVTFPADPPPKK
jgi:hypothetical protein